MLHSGEARAMADARRCPKAQASPDKAPVWFMHLHRLMTAPGGLGRGPMIFIALLAACGSQQNGLPPNAAPSPTPPIPSAAAEPAHESEALRAKLAVRAADASVPAQAFRERADERKALARRLAQHGIHDAAVLHAIETVPRHAFVLPGWQAQAYADHPLPIVGDQTISQPYVVAFMTEAVEPKRSSKCLEIGTGSGYQAAILAELCQRTYSIEYLAEVARFGAKNLRDLGYGSDRVELRVGDGYEGWPEAAPFDVIVVTAAPAHVPKPLLDQLALGGRLVIPVGATQDVQELELWTRLGPGSAHSAFRRRSLLPVRFVPFAGERAQGRETP
jgi:protein-L-isoaspartate(D-aspartate) O-methyltransferase